MSLSWLEKHEQVIKKCLESEKAFRTYLTKNPNNVRRAFLAFRGLVRLFSELVDNQKELEKKVNELEHAKSRMEKALTYVKDQLNTFQAGSSALSAPIASSPSPTPVAPMATHPIRYPTLPIQSPTAPSPAIAPASVAPGSTHVFAPAPTSPLPTSSEYDVPSASNRSHVARVIKIPDPKRFYADKGKDEITYEDWHLQMLSKMSINASTMLTKAAKRGYVQS